MRQGGEMHEVSLFLSYRRGAATTPAVERLYNRAMVELPVYGVREVFFDRRSIDAGDPWSPALDAALTRTTHFLALVSIDYWLSKQCQRELTSAIDRYEVEQAPKLLFVLADPLDPQNLVLNADSRPYASRLRALGEINFLGPYDRAGRLVHLALGSQRRLDAQLSKLVNSLQDLLRSS